MASVEASAVFENGERIGKGFRRFGGNVFSLLSREHLVIRQRLSWLL